MVRYMPRELHPENLIPLNKRTKEKQREITSKAGKRSGEVRREKKMLSQYYNDLLQRKFKVKVDGEIVEKEGSELILDTLLKVMKRGDSASVSAIKEIREATEGTKSDIKVSEFSLFIEKSKEKANNLENA